MNKKAFSLDKETLVILLVLLFFLIIVIMGYNKIYKGSETAKGGLLDCKSLAGSCVAKGQCEPEGREATQGTGCDSETEVCCISKQSIVKTTA